VVVNHFISLVQVHCQIL